MNEFELNGGELNGGALVAGATTSGVTTLHTRVEVIPLTGASSLDTAVKVVINPSSSTSMPTCVRVTAQGDASLPTAVQVLDKFLTEKWSARVLIDGVDWSARVTGQVVVDAEEGSARVASFTIRPPSGAIDPTEWTGKSVTVDLLRKSGGVGYPSRVFTGVVEVCSYDPSTRLFALDCTDDLQLVVAKMTREDIDTLTGAVYHEAVMGVIEDNWEYAQALMETREASLDISRYGGLRVTQWQGLPTWHTFGVGELLDESLDVDMLRRSELVNEVRIDSQYRYFICRERGDGLGWSQLSPFTFGFQKTGYTRPSQSEILGALSGTGWQTKHVTFYPPNYDLGKYVSCGIWVEGVSFGGSIGTMYHVIGFDQISGFHAKMGLRYAQTVTEYHNLVVRAPQSIAANGTIPKDITVACESEWDSSGWESWEEPGLYPSYDKDTGTSSGTLIPTEPVGGVGLVELYHAPDAPRTYMQDAQEIAIAKAKVMIVASHRKGMARASIDCRPEIDLDMRVGINSATLIAEGKVSQVVHTLDIAAGTAVTEFRLAVSGVGAVGFATPTPLIAPDPVDTAIPADSWGFPGLGTYYPDVHPYTESLNGLVINPPESVPFIGLSGCTQTGSMQAHVVNGGPAYAFSGFRVELPGVDDAHRDSRLVLAETDYVIDLVQDPLTQIV